MIVSNIPFGNFRVYDKSFNEPTITNKIHNYFFAKGLEKIKDGGILAFLTTDAFLNSVSNETARKYLFDNADFISLAVMPDNLMKDTGNTEAPSHLIIVQKNSSKDGLTDDEQLLLNTIEQENEFGKYNINHYIHQHADVIIGDEIKPGKDQYGKAHQTIWQHEDINLIGKKLAFKIFNDVAQRVNRNAFAMPVVKEEIYNKPKLTFIAAPENKQDNTSVQLGLFDVMPAENINRAMAYINELDETVVQKQTARVVQVIKAADQSEHEAFVLLTAKSKLFKQYVYKLCSNTKEVDFPKNWLNASAVGNELNDLSIKLQEFNHDFFVEGTSEFHFQFGNRNKKSEELNDLESFYKEGTLIVHDNRVGFVSYAASKNENPVFLPGLNEKKDLSFYQQYVVVRDAYFNLPELENTDNIEYAHQREILNNAYDNFIAQYGILNAPGNRQRILKDEAFGAIILSSLERKEGGQHIKADILTQSFYSNQRNFYDR